MWRSGLHLAALSLSASPALTQDCAAPCLDYAVSLELQDDAVLASTPSFLRSNDLEPTFEAAVALKPFDRVALIAHATTEAVIDKRPGRDRAFADIGTYMEQLHARFDFAPVRIRAGKFEPAFGLATRVLDGIAATDIVGDYDNDERWGGEIRLALQALGLDHAVTLNAFTTDRTALSGSLFSDRGRLRLSDGGAGNAKGVASLAAVLDGCKGAPAAACFADGRFGYRLGLRHQKAGHPSEADVEDNIRPHDELGVLAAATARHEFSDDTVLRVLAEVAYFDHIEGGPDDAVIATASLALAMAPLTTMATYSHRSNLAAAGAGTADHLFDFTAVYEFGEGRSIAAGYSYAETGDGETAHTLSAVLTIDFEGSIDGAVK